MVGIALVLLLIGSMLHVRTGWSIEDFLGAADDATRKPAWILVEGWRAQGLLWLARTYLWLDSAVFVPVYAAFALRIARLLVRSLQEDAGWDGSRHRRWTVLLWLPVVTLVIVDWLENALGMLRLGTWAPLLALSAVAAGLAGLAALGRLPGWHFRQYPLLLVIGMATAAAVVGAAQWSNKELCRTTQAGAWLGPLNCAAHQGKSWLAGVVILVLVVAAVAWLYGAVLAWRNETACILASIARRTALRQAMLDCLGRSRYVLVAILLMAALTVVMDQSRDVIASTASFVPRILTLVDADWVGVSFSGDGSAIQGWRAAGLLLGSLTVFGASILALALLVFSCWLWTRSVCNLRAAGRPVPAPGAVSQLRPEDVFAKDWARLLALVPVLLTVLLCADVLRDLAMSRPEPQDLRTGWSWLDSLVPSVGVVAFAILAVLGGGNFIWRRSGRASGFGYYDCVDWKQWSQHFGFTTAMPVSGTGLPPGQPAFVHKYNFLGVVTPYLLPAACLVLLMACRLVDAWPGRSGEYFPTMAFPVILLSLAFWLCVFGWLSLMEVYAAVPWVLALLIWIGVAGALGWTDNHLVWPGPLPGDVNPWGLVFMLLCSAALGFALWVAYRWAMRRVRDPGTDGTFRKFSPILLVFPAMVIVIASVGNGWATARRPVVDSADTGPPGVPLEKAMAQWLQGLCAAPDEKSSCAPKIAPDPASGGIDVYFVSSEGGGIRAAVWTAMALQRLEAQDADFPKRTFSISGVSGGAVGAAVYRACWNVKVAGPAGVVGNEDAARCIRQFAQTDLLSPLLSSWMFEDLLGKVVPTTLCATPGCGFMSRGAWFEQAMEQGAPRLRRGMRWLHQQDAKDGHVPYLMLNATWVETGERAIASELAISAVEFPASKDQLGLVGADMPLGAAAHNAARFPYVNAIGSLKAPRDRCAQREEERQVGASGAANSSAVKEPCGHVADGGYFDNGGAQTTSDVLRALVRCLLSPSSVGARTPCQAIPASHKQWLRDRLIPQILMIRNQTDLHASMAENCDAYDPVDEEEAKKPQTMMSCATPIGQRYRPARPTCARGGVPYLDLIGPALTVYNSGGVGAGGRLAEARQAEAVAVARVAIGGVAATTSKPTVTAVELLPRGVHFPLGWHLSRQAVDEMENQASHCTLTGMR